MKSNWRLLLLIFFMALLPRAVYLAGFQNNPFFDFNAPRLDPYFFQKCAEAFAGGDLLARNPTGDSFGSFYKYFAGVLFVCFGPNLFLLWIVQFLIGALSTVFLFAVTRRIFGILAAFFAAIFFMLYAPTLCFEGTMLRVSLTQFFAIASCLFALKVTQERKTRHTIVLGILLSLMIQCRPNTVLVLPFLLFFLLRIPRPTRWKTISSFFLAFLLASAPLLILAGTVHKRFVFYDASGPKVFYYSNLPEYLGYGWQREYEEQWTDPEFPVKTYSGVAFSLVKRFLSNPLGYLSLYLKKLYYFFANYEPTVNLDYYFYATYSFLLRWPLSNAALVFGLGLIGILLSLMGRKNQGIPLAFLLGTSLSVLLFYNLSRFRLVAVPFYIIFASSAAAIFLREIRKGHSKAFLMIPAAGLFVFFFRNPLDPESLDAKKIEGPAWIGARYAFKEGEEDFAKAEQHLLQSWNYSARKRANRNFSFDFLKDLYKKEAHLLLKEKNNDTIAEALEKLLLFDFETPSTYLALGDVPPPQRTRERPSSHHGGSFLRFFTRGQRLHQARISLSS